MDITGSLWLLLTTTLTSRGQSQLAYFFICVRYQKQVFFQTISRHLASLCSEEIYSVIQGVKSQQLLVRLIRRENHGRRAETAESLLLRSWGFTSVLIGTFTAFMSLHLIPRFTSQDLVFNQVYEIVMTEGSRHC